MRVLIDKQAAIDALHAWERVYTWDETCLEDRAKVYAPSEVIEALPATEPGIVRCKDCKWYGRADKRRFYRGTDCLNHRIDTIVPDKDYCSRAERRTDATD